MRVYISGPMSGYENYNREAFHAAHARLESHGFDVLNPAVLDEHHPLPEGMADGSPEAHAWYMRRDIAALLDCDLIYLLPGWRWSKGASLEARVAEGCGIPVLHDTNRDIWRTFEGHPEGQRYEVTTPDPTPTEDLSAVVAEVAALAPAGDEDLSDHPRFGSVFADLDIEVDDTLPERTLRLETPAGSVDFEVIEDAQRGIRLVRKPAYHLADLEQHRPGDEFPNVGYVRRFLAMLRLPTPGEHLDAAHNEGARRSA